MPQNDAPMSESWSRHMATLTGTPRPQAVIHGKWKQTSACTRTHYTEVVSVQPESPVGVMLSVYGVTKVVLHFEDGTEEYWERVS